MESENDNKQATSSGLDDPSCSHPDWNYVQWRTLKKGETIKEGDWVDTSPGFKDEPKWKLTGCIGEAAPDPQFPAHRVYRRITGENKPLVESAGGEDEMMMGTFTS